MRKARLGSRLCRKKLMSENCSRNIFMTQATCWNDKFLEKPYYFAQNSDSIRKLWCVFINFACFAREIFSTVTLSWRLSWRDISRTSRLKLLPRHMFTTFRNVSDQRISFVLSLKSHSDKWNFTYFLKHVKFREVWLIDKTDRTFTEQKFFVKNFQESPGNRWRSSKFSDLCHSFPSNRI